MSTFAKRLKLLRLASGLSQADLAKEVGLTASAIGMYEQGRREPSLSPLSEIADYFNVDVDYLLGKEDQTTILDPTRLGSRYYHDPGVARLAEQISTNPDLRLLFDAAKDVAPEDLSAVHQILKSMKKKETESDVE